MIGWTSFVVLAVVIAGVPFSQAGTGFHNAISKEACTMVLYSLSTPKGEIDCDDMFNWAKCVVRVIGLDKRVPTTDDIKIFNEYLDQILYDVRMECVITISDVINALRPDGATPEPVVSATTAQPMYPSSRTTAYPGYRDCLPYSEDACADRADGNYPACFPLCQKGIFITCTNFLAKIMDCPKGWYQPRDKIPPEGRFAAPLVYNSFWDMCLEAAPDCPRIYDSQIPE